MQAVCRSAAASPARKFAVTMVSLQEDQAKAQKEKKRAEEDRRRAERRAEELEMRLQGL